MCSISMCVVYVAFIFMFFFFKQKTAYEMRISDWSSDVCSSDLGWWPVSHHAKPADLQSGTSLHPHPDEPDQVHGRTIPARADGQGMASGLRCRRRSPRPRDCQGNGRLWRRSEERRVGKECVSPCKSRCSPDL